MERPTLYFRGVIMATRQGVFSISSFLLADGMVLTINHSVVSVSSFDCKM